MSTLSVQGRTSAATPQHQGVVMTSQVLQTGAQSATGSSAQQMTPSVTLTPDGSIVKRVHEVLVSPGKVRSIASPVILTSKERNPSFVWFHSSIIQFATSCSVCND